MEKVKEKSSFFRKFVGDKRFYLMVLSIAVPIMVQNGITNFVSLLDNIMIGRIGTEQMSGAAIVNQLIFVYNLCHKFEFAIAFYVFILYSTFKAKQGRCLMNGQRPCLFYYFGR